jgi:Right handed beta helix region/Periplasmic copper-binding protein (NosD)
MTMSANRRILVAVSTLVLVGVFALGLWLHHGGTPRGAAGVMTVKVTNPGDSGPGSLREALFIAAAANSKATVLIDIRRITLKTALPPLLNGHGVSIVGPAGGVEIDAQALAGGPVFDVAGANTSLEELLVRNCSGPAVLLRAAHFRLQSNTIESCDVGVEVAENASDVLLEHNRFSSNRIGVRFTAANRNTVVTGNSFLQERAAGLWAVRGEPQRHADAIDVLDNRFDGDHSGVVAGNVAIRIERNDFTANAPDAAIHLVGAGAVVRANRVSGTAAMGIVAENAREVVIEGNQLEHLRAYAIMIRSSANALVRGNRMLNCDYGIAFVLGDPSSPSTAVDNTIVEPRFDGIDVIGDSPILRRNQVLRPQALAFRVAEFQQPGAPSVRAKPFLEGNNFGADGARKAAGTDRIHETARAQ